MTGFLLNELDWAVNALQSIAASTKLPANQTLATLPAWVATEMAAKSKS